MDIKQFLLEGGRITHPHKKLIKEWVGQVSIHIFAGYYKKPHIIIDGDISPINYPLQEIDKAIEHYKSLVFTPTNIMYKMNETIRELCDNGEEIDLDEEDVFNRVNTLRKAKVLKAVRNIKNKN